MSPGDSLRTALARLHEDCPEVTGAVLATGEGLILAATGQLASDAAAATAAHLAEEVDRCLALLSDRGCDRVLIWGEAAIWCLVRLPGGGTLLARATADCRAGALKLAVEGVAQDLSPSPAHPGRP